jgi:hypothetical protein
MKEFLEPHVIISLAVIFGSLSAVAITLVIVLRDKISDVRVSRTGFEIRTNDVPIWSEVVDKIERIDSNTSKSVRKGTAELMILDPDQHDMSAEAMLVIREANQPLIYAAYENHHTREIDSDPGAYLADKAHDILAAVRIWKKLFPELTDEKSEVFASHWFKKILLPNVRRACVEKVAYYKKQIGRCDVSKTIRSILIGYLGKNERYITCIDHLIANTDIGVKSSVFYPMQSKGDGRLQATDGDKENVGGDS